MSVASTTGGGSATPNSTNGTIEEVPTFRGCPVCKAPILPQGQGEGEGQRIELEAAVDALPTDVTTVATIESQRVLNSSHVCVICENGVQTLSYCLQVRSFLLTLTLKVTSFCLFVICSIIHS
jgi:hypothetical protein